MKEIKVGVIGCGYWGPNLIRNFNENPHTDIRYACDLDLESLNKIKLRYPSVITTRNYRDLLRDKDLQLIAVATPVHTHYRLGHEILSAGKHLLMEKPLAASIRDAEKLVSIARQKNLMLFVDHTFIYTGAVRKMKGFISAGTLGDLYYFDSVRVNLGLFQSDVNVVWDLASHDVSIMDYLMEGEELARPDLQAHILDRFQVSESFRNPDNRDAHFFPQIRKFGTQMNADF